MFLNGLMNSFLEKVEAGWKPALPGNAQIVEYMIPIQELLNRIRWDPEFGQGSFQLGYFDRTENRVILVPLKELSFPEERPGIFEFTDAEGHTHHVPFHRVREVYRDSQRIWNRPQQEKFPTQP